MHAFGAHARTCQRCSSRERLSVHGALSVDGSPTDHCRQTMAPLFSSPLAARDSRVHGGTSAEMSHTRAAVAAKSRSSIRS